MNTDFNYDMYVPTHTLFGAEYPANGTPSRCRAAIRPFRTVSKH